LATVSPLILTLRLHRGRLCLSKPFVKLHVDHIICRFQVFLPQLKILLRFTILLKIASIHDPSSLLLGGTGRLHLIFTHLNLTYLFHCLLLRLCCLRLLFLLFIRLLIVLKHSSQLFFLRFLLLRLRGSIPLVLRFYFLQLFFFVI